MPAQAPFDKLRVTASLSARLCHYAWKSDLTVADFDLPLRLVKPVSRSTTRVVLADPHYLSRTGLRDAIADLSFMKVVAEVETRDEFKKALALKPDMIVIDMFAGSLTGILPSDFLGTPKVVVVSSNNSPENVSIAIEHNVASYLTKVCDKEEIQQAFTSVVKGERFFCNQILEIILQQHSPKPEENCKPSKLSAREVEVVKLIATGMTTNGIARELHLSPHTVYTHRKNIMRKVNVNSAPELVLYAVTEGLIVAG